MDKTLHRKHYTENTTLKTLQKTLHSKHYTQNTTQKTNSRLNDTNLTKTLKSISGTSEELAVPGPLVTSVVLHLLTVR